MIDIKFRARRTGDRTWITGDLTHTLRITRDADVPCIRVAGYDIDESTIGRFTGLRDIHGAEIYEGDILRWYTPMGSITFTVLFRPGAFIGDSGNAHFPLFPDSRYEIIGNIHETDK